MGTSVADHPPGRLHRRFRLDEDVLTVDRVPEDHPDLVRLASAMVEEMAAVYGGDVSTWRLVPPRGAWLVLRDDTGAAVACVGILPLDVAEPGSPPEMGELKRLYVDPAARGRGLGRRAMDEGVALARSLGYEQLWLETGELQPVAIGLYERLGWTRIPSFGPYADERSVCFALDLRAAS